MRLPCYRVYSVDAVVSTLQGRHTAFLSRVPPTQLSRLVAQLCNGGGGAKGALSGALESIDLTKCSDTVIEAAKAQMDKHFHQLRPGDPGYVYDKTQVFVSAPPLRVTRAV